MARGYVFGSGDDHEDHLHEEDAAEALPRPPSVAATISLLSEDEVDADDSDADEDDDRDSRSAAGGAGSDDADSDDAEDDDPKDDDDDDDDAPVDPPANSSVALSCRAAAVGDATIAPTSSRVSPCVSAARSSSDGPTSIVEAPSASVVTSGLSLSHDTLVDGRSSQLSGISYALDSDGESSDGGYDASSIGHPCMSAGAHVNSPSGVSVAVVASTATSCPVMSQSGSDFLLSSSAVTSAPDLGSSSSTALFTNPISPALPSDSSTEAFNPVPHSPNVDAVDVRSSVVTPVINPLSSRIPITVTPRSLSDLSSSVGRRIVGSDVPSTPDSLVRSMQEVLNIMSVYLILARSLNLDDDSVRRTTHQFVDDLRLVIEYFGFSTN